MEADIRARTWEEISDCQGKQYLIVSSDCLVTAAAAAAVQAVIGTAVMAAIGCCKAAVVPPEILLGAGDTVTDGAGIGGESCREL